MFGEEGYAAQRWVKPSLQFAILNSIVVIALLIIWASLGPHDNLMGMLVATLTCVILAQVIIDLVSAKFQLEAKHNRLAAWQLITHPLRLVGLLLLVFYVRLLTPLHVALVYLAISLLVILIGLFHLASFYRGTFHPAGHQKSTDSVKSKVNRKKSSLKDIFFRTTPFGLESFLFLVYYQTDLVLLHYLVSEEEVGFYAASCVLMSAAYLLPSVLYQKFLLPKIHRWAYEKSNRLESFIKEGAILLFLGGALVTLIIWYAAPYIIPLAFGEEYQSSVSLLMLMSLAIPFRYLAVHLGSVLCTRDLIWKNLRITSFTALLNVLLNLLLIPEHGAVGAAVAMVVSYIILAGLFLFSTQKKC